MICVHQCFQAVGHGTFFTGVVARDSEVPIFSWVYDCGSKRTTRLDAEITDIERWEYWPDEIDLFVLSHFDDDHVNGVERFLRSRRVVHLALPYMDAAQRLGAAASISDDACSASTALFQLDPLLWLRRRGLSDRVDTILLVQAGPRGPNEQPRDIRPQPLPLAPDQDVARREAIRSEDDMDLQADYLQGVEVFAGDPKLLTWRDTTPMSDYRFPVEFMFFNTEQNNQFRKIGIGSLVAKRSGASIGTVQADVNAVMRRYRLTDLSKPPRRHWREALRKVYDRHFGHSSQARNNISLCLLIRPLSTGTDACDGLFEREDCEFPTINRMETMARYGLLLLGDLRVDSTVIDEMKRHFGSARWGSISGVQVPHHGSQHSWAVGNASDFAPDWFVHCVPDNSAHHPHKLVEGDLAGFEVLRADYNTRIAFNYHFVP